MLKNWIAIIVSLFVSARVFAATFSNPIDASGQDPWVIQWHGSYYYCWSDGSINVSRADRLQDIAVGSRTTIWRPPSGQAYSQEIWAPELHFLHGKWYVYFAADDGVNDHHRMYVLESAGDNPFGPYTLRGKIFDTTDRWAIDGTVLDYSGQLYFIWSGWEGTANVQQNLYIAPMTNPWTISGPRVLISQPTNAWEHSGGPPYINEGPETLTHNGKVFIVYSASGSWTDDYCLGRLTLSGTNLLSAASWTKTTAPVFSKTAAVFGPGHASFVKSTDQTQDWIVYHSAKYSGAGWDRQVSAKQFSWNADGSPNFGAPITPGLFLNEPSGSPFGITYEAENALINNATVIASSLASGQSKVGKIDFADSYLQFTVNVAKDGQYRLNVRYGAGLGIASHALSVNGTFLQNVTYPAGAWDNWQFQTNTLVTLRAGTNSIRLAKASGYAELDFIAITRGPEGDIDADNLPDAWEQLRFGQLYDPCGDANADCDGDGQTVLQEYQADTDPLDAGSFLRLTSIHVNNGQPEIHWQGGALANQTIERATNLESPPLVWDPISMITAPTASSGVFIDQNAPVRALYRIRTNR